MIGSYGGLITGADGSRSYPGSGGYIGGFSIPNSANYAKVTGAGDAYHVFTPMQNDLVAPPIEPRDCPEGQICGGTGGGGGGGGTGGCGTGPGQEPCPTGGGGGGTGGGTDTGDGGPQYPIDPNTIPSGGVWTAIQSLLTPSPRTSVNASGPAYLFTPQAPAGVTNGIPPIYLLVLAVVGVGGYFVYKKVK